MKVGTSEANRDESSVVEGGGGGGKEGERGTKREKRA